MEKFYNFQWAQMKNEILFESLSSYDEQSLICGKAFLGEPLTVRVSEGKKFYDIVHLQDPFNFTISNRLYSILKQAGLTGWRDYEIELVGKDEKYHGFQVLGKSGKVKRPFEPGFVNGYEFEHETWDGSDFFIPEGTLLIFCSQRVKNLFELNKITNTDLRDISTIKWYSV